MDVFQALSVPKRREIVELLADQGQMTSTDISNEFKITSAAISQHLRVLREADVVKMEKQAQRRLYTINTDSLEKLEAWARKMKVTWNKRFDRLEALLSKKGGH